MKLRAALLKKVREFFDQRGFLEVETPLLSHETVVDRYLEPLPVILENAARSSDNRCWLQTSPELGMKRLLAAGGGAIYQITRAFRGGEQGRLHNIEFTIVEWYRPGDDMQAGMQLLSEFCDTMLQQGPAEQVSYRKAFERALGIDPLTCSLAELQGAAGSLEAASETAAATPDRDELLNLLLALAVEPNLGITRPTILYDYPPSQAALARVRPDGPPVAERFELYVQGIELANGYHELLDADVLRERIATANELRAADGNLRLPECRRLLAAMDHGLPACTGVALGFDRLAMIAAGAASLAEVMAFPSDHS